MRITGHATYGNLSVLKKIYFTSITNLLKDLFSFTGAVEVWSVEDKAFECKASQAEHDDFITSLSVNSDKTRAISTSQDGK